MDVFQSVYPAILLSVPDGGQADIDGNDFSGFWRAEYAADTAPAAQIQHPVTLAAIVGADLLVLKRLIDGGKYYESLPLKGNRRPNRIENPDVIIPEGHKSVLGRR